MIRWHRQDHDTMIREWIADHYKKNPWQWRRLHGAGRPHRWASCRSDGTDKKKTIDSPTRRSIKQRRRPTKNRTIISTMKLSVRYRLRRMRQGDKTIIRWHKGRIGSLTTWRKNDRSAKKKPKKTKKNKPLALCEETNGLDPMKRRSNRWTDDWYKNIDTMTPDATSASDNKKTSDATSLSSPCASRQQCSSIFFSKA